MDIVPDDYLLEEIHTCLAERKQELLETRNFLYLVVFGSSSSRAANLGDRYTRVCLFEKPLNKKLSFQKARLLLGRNGRCEPFVKKPNSKSQPTQPLFNESVVSVGRV